MKLRFSVAAIFLFCWVSAFAQDACKNRGDLDTQYCDDNADLVADAPKDS